LFGQGVFKKAARADRENSHRHKNGLIIIFASPRSIPQSEHAGFDPNTGTLRSLETGTNFFHANHCAKDAWLRLQCGGCGPFLVILPNAKK
jgi:hypothetical protein